MFEENGDFFFSDPNALKPDQKSVTTYDSIFTSLTTDTKGNLEPQFLAASLTKRTLQFYFISYVSYTSCPDKCVLQSPKALEVIKLPLIT